MIKREILLTDGLAVYQPRIEVTVSDEAMKDADIIQGDILRVFINKAPHDGPPPTAVATYAGSGRHRHRGSGGGGQEQSPVVRRLPSVGRSGRRDRGLYPGVQKAGGLRGARPPCLPLSKELGRMAIMSFRKCVALWDASDAPVSGQRFAEYRRIAQLTAALLSKNEE